MKDWEQTLIAPEASLHDVIQQLNDTAMQICLVVDKDRILHGTVTDGDIRRGLLRGLDLNTNVTEVMNTSPQCIAPSCPRNEILEKMNTLSLHHLPMVEMSGRVIGLELFDDLVQKPSKRPNWVLLLAGGQGSRLRPLTEDRPKPMLNVGGKPILETILDSFRVYGFQRFYISINYLGEQIREYFGDGRAWGVEIRYLEESEPRGTAGPLSLIPETLEDPLVVMNGDLLTRVNYEQLLAYHEEHDQAITMCVRDYEFQVPYGVVRVEEHCMADIIEKPVHSFFVNAGIYVVAPSIVSHVPKEGVFDMPMLLRDVKQRNEQVSVFPIREYWLDIGRMEEFEKANSDFMKWFGHKETSVD